MVGYLSSYEMIKLARVLVLVLLGFFLVSCAASRAYRRGMKAGRAERYADAVRHLSEAAARDPDNPGYRIALSSALVQSGEAHLKRGDAFERGGELELAYKEYSDAFADNPLNDRAQLKRDLLRKRLLAEASAPKAPKVAPIPSPLAAFTKRPVSLKMSDAELKDVFTSIERLTGVTFIYDEAFGSKKVSVSFQDLSFREVLDRLMLMYRLFYKPLNPRTILIVPDNEAKRAEYEEQLIKTFYLYNSDPAKVSADLRTMVELKRVMVHPELRAITIKDTAERLELVRRLIEKADMRRAEIVVDMEILEFNRNRLLQFGLDFSSYAVGGAVALNATDAFPQGSLIRGHMLGSIGLSDVLFSIPTVVYRLLRTDTRTKLIARPQLRAVDGEDVVIKVGDKVPIPLTTFVSIAGGGLPNQPITSFQMTDIGLTVEIKPTVHLDQEVTLKAKFELTSIVREGTVNLPPTMGNRSFQTTIRLKDGETTLIAGLIKEEERQSRSGLPGLMNLPVLGHLFGANQQSSNQTDIAFTITPHIVRMAEIGEQEMRPVWAGTEKVLRISDEPPPYAQPEAAQPAAETPSLAPDEGGAREAVPEAVPSAEPPPAPVPQSQPSSRSPEPASPEEAPRAMQPLILGFEPREVFVPPGQQFSMGVNLVAAAGDRRASRCSFTIAYDEGLLEVSRVQAAEGLSVQLDAQPGRIAVAFESPGGHAGAICTVIFMARSPGRTVLEIGESFASDAAGLPFDVSFIPALITIFGTESAQTLRKVTPHSNFEG